MTLRHWIYFAVFAVAPGLAYQRIQDVSREAMAGPDAPAWLGYALGIGPNFLGGVSLTAGLIVIAREMRKATASHALDRTSALIALAGLWAWEFTQRWLPNGTFDPHDLAWTVPGVLIGWLAARNILPRD